MGPGFFRSSALALRFVVFAMVLRAVIPAGYMPEGDRAAGGGFGFAICHGTVTDSDAPGENDGSRRTKQDCPFSLVNRLVMAAIEAPLPDFVLRSFSGLTPALEKSSRLTGRGSVHLWARAPPSLRIEKSTVPV